MACNSYSNNGSPNIVLTPTTLPDGTCFTGAQDIINKVAQYVVGTLPGNYTTFLISDTTPAAIDRDKLWVSVDTNCKPLGFFLYSTTYGVWLAVDQHVIDATPAATAATGTANALICLAPVPNVKFLMDGYLFVVKAGTSANTGAATLNVGNTGAYAIRKQGGLALEGGEILPNMVLLLSARETAGIPFYELLNAAPAAANIVPENRVINGSFEIDSDADGKPDGWTFTPVAAGTGTGAINSSAGTVVHGANSYAITITATGGGTLTQNEKMPCNEGEVMALSFWHRTSAATTTDLVTVQWFDRAGASVAGPTTIWSGVATTRVAGTWYRIFAGMSAPTGVGACFFQINLVGGSTNAGNPATCYFDGVLVDTVIFKRKCSYLYTGAATTVSYNFVPPSGVTMVRATVIGGGGTGGVDGAWGAGGGGGAGGTAVAISPVTIGTSYTVVVGAGGAGGVGVVNNGNNSSFNSVIGAGGVAGAIAAITGGAGGSGTIPAGSQGWIFTGGTGIDGNNGGTPAGAGGNGSGGGGFPGTGAAGGVGSQYGGGGGGTDGAFATGSGAHGAVFIEF